MIGFADSRTLEDLLRGILSARDALESACREQIAAAERQSVATQEEATKSLGMLEDAAHAENAANQAAIEARQNLESAASALGSAESALSACEAQPPNRDGDDPDCSAEEAAVANAAATVNAAEADLRDTKAELDKAQDNLQRMKARVELATKASALADQAYEHSRAECAARFAAVSQSVEIASKRLSAAQQALDGYLATNPSAAQFHSWLHWNPANHGAPITPVILRDRMNLPANQRTLLQEYLYERNPAYRGLVDRYRGEWAAAKGDAERNIVARKTRIHLSGEFGEQMARHALSPLGGRIETQGRTYVGDSGRYTKTDLVVTNLRVPVVLGRGKGMGAPIGGSMAFEVKCGKADYLYSQKDHMVFQAEGHKQADAQCTLCSRDVHDLPSEKEKELRDALSESGSPLVGMLNYKNEIDQSCLVFVQQEGKEKP